jgi:hypothetical protein
MAAIPLDLAFVPSKTHFNEDVIASYIVGQQNFRKGRLLVAASYVSCAKALPRGDSFHYSAAVNSEKSTGVCYLVKVKFGGNKIDSSSCTCAGQGAAHHRCKHVAALLLALLALKHYTAERPKWAHRPGVQQRLGKLPDDHPMRKAGRASLTWEQTISEMCEPTRAAPTNGVVPKLQAEPVEKKRGGKKKKLYCLCRQPYEKNDDRAMIECDGCQEWYHYDCLETWGDAPALPQGNKRRLEWMCKFCTGARKSK